MKHGWGKATDHLAKAMCSHPPWTVMMVALGYGEDLNFKPETLFSQEQKNVKSLFIHNTGTCNLILMEYSG